jgi:hypothetical protein
MTGVVELHMEEVQWDMRMGFIGGELERPADEMG